MPVSFFPQFLSPCPSSLSSLLLSAGANPPKNTLKKYPSSCFSDGGKSLLSLLCTPPPLCNVLPFYPPNPASVHIISIPPPQPLLKLKSISKLRPFHVPLQPSILSKWSLRSKHEVNLFVFCHDEYFMDCLPGFSYIIWDSLDSSFCTFIFFFHQKFIWRLLTFLTTWTRTKLCPGSFCSYVTFLDLCNGYSIIHLLTITQVMGLKWIHEICLFVTDCYIELINFSGCQTLTRLFHHTTISIYCRNLSTQSYSLQGNKRGDYVANIVWKKQYIMTAYQKWMNILT